MTTILVVEDEAVVAADIAQRLKRGGYDVPAVAATGEAALRMTEELHPDLVLMDILLKGEKDGIETAREIEDQFEIPIIFLTGQADESTLERVRNTSHYGFLLKPIDTASLFPTVEMALTRHAFAVQLKESESRFRAVTDSAVEAILSMDMQGNVTYWNKAAERTFGWTADEITGQSVAAIIPESAKAGFFRMLPELGTRETYVPPSFTLWRRKDGTEFPAEPSFASWKTKEGTFATAIVRDVSEQKKMEAAIAENEARFRSVVETATDAIITTNASGDIVFWNPAAEKMFGYTAEEARGKPLVSLAPQQMQKSASEAFIHFVQDTFSQRGTHESQAQRKDGSLFETETSYAPWTIDSQKFATSFVHDISDRKRTQERLASFNECLLKFGPDPIRNISSLTALCGDLLEASSAFYVHFGEQNEAWGRWNAPEGWGLGEFSDGQLLFESAQRSALEPAVIRDLSRSEFAQTDPSVQRYNWQTYIGTLAIAAAEPVGALALIFTDDRSPSTEDLRIVQLTVSAIGVEESRWTAQQEIKQREAQQKAIFESVQTGIALIDPKTHRIVDVNTTAAHLFGASKEAIIGSVCHRFICPAAVGRCPITDLEQTVDNAERVLLTADGKSRPILKSVSKITLGGHAYLLESFIDISDRKQMELALLESEAYYRAIFESTATGMAIVEEDMTVAMVNGILEQLTGYSKNEVEGLKPWTDFVAPEDLELMKTYHRARRRDDGRAPKGYEFRLLTKDGTRREAFLTVALIPGTRRSVVSIVDLTALKTAQEAVRKQAGMLDAAHDAIMTLDPEGTITYWNRGAERLYGWTKQEVMGQNANALLITTFPESREALWPKLMESGLWEGELIHVTRDGIPVTVASSWTLLKDEKGNASAILEISSDITERKKAQLALADSEAKLRITFASMTDGIVLNGLDRKVTDCNEAVLRLTQRSREEIIGKPFTDLLAPEFRSQILETIPELLEKGAIRTNSKMLRKNGESVDVEANVSLIKDAAGQPTAFLTVTRDVTERKKAELALADSEAKLRITFATMVDGIVIVGLDEKVTDCNEAVLRLTQRSRGRDNRKPFADLLLLSFVRRSSKRFLSFWRRNHPPNSKMLRKMQKVLT